MTVGREGTASCDRRGVTPRDPEKLGRRSSGGRVEDAVSDADVPKVLVDVELIVRFNGRLKNPGVDGVARGAW